MDNPSAKRSILVTGAGGFVGGSVVLELARRDFEARALTHHRPVAASLNVTPVQADLFDAAALRDAMADCSAVIHLVGVIVEKRSAGVTFQRMHVDATRAVISAAAAAGVSRYVHMSALGTRPDAASAYHRTKFAAEEAVRQSPLNWTIFRPSMIHGPRGDFMRMEGKWARKRAAPFLFMPWFGGGALGLRAAGTLAPVYVEDVARAFVDAIDNRAAIGQTYDLAGPEAFAWPEFHRLAARAIIGRNRWSAPLPAWTARAMAAALPAKLLGFNGDQVIMSQEKQSADMAPFERDFGWRPRAFAPTLESYAREI